MTEQAQDKQAQSTKKEGKNGEHNKRKNYQSFKRQSNEEIFQSISKDGRYQIIKMVRTFVVPIKYIETVYNSHFVDELAKYEKVEQ